MKGKKWIRNRWSSHFLIRRIDPIQYYENAGAVEREKVLVLIDSGASHSFISAKLVAELSLVVEKTPPYKVCLGDGNRMTTSGCCPDILIQLEDLEVKEKFYLFELGCGLDFRSDVVGFLGKVKITWRNLTMSFGQGKGRC